jgi:uncharacterized protein involved in exopolysaccharide biosynthesis
MIEIPENKEKSKNSELDLIDIFHKIWSQKKIILKSTVSFFVIGLIYGLFSPKEYKSEVLLMVETRSKSGGVSALVQQFSGLSGIDFGQKGNDEGLVTRLYPQIIKTTPFLLEIMSQKVTESKYDSVLTVAQYIDRYTKPSPLSLVMNYTIGLPYKIISLFQRNKGLDEDLPRLDSIRGPLKLTPKQVSIIGVLANSINAKEGTDNTLVISVSMQDPKVAALLTDSVVKCLAKYIISYRTQKAKMDLDFVSERNDEARIKYVQAQKALAVYRDQNKNVISAAVLTEQERLQAEYNLAFNLYNTLSQQLEQSRIKVQEITPVFKIMDPAKVPLRKDKPKIELNLLIMLFIGLFTGIGIIYIKSIFKNNKVRLINE